MVQKRTINKILEKILSGKTAKTRMRGYWYNIYYDKDYDHIVAEPIGAGDILVSSMEADDYRYTHAGEIAREVQQLIWEVDELMRAKTLADEVVE